MGFLELLSTEYNNFLAAALILQRIIHGYAAFLGCKVTVECCRAWFPDHIDLSVGIEVSAYYLGGSLAILMGGHVYEIYGYQASYMSFGSISLLIWVYNLMFMPKTSDPVFVDATFLGTEDTIEAPCTDEKLLSEDSTKLGASKGSEEPIPPYGLSLYAAIPLAAMSLTVVLEGFSAAITTSYLKETFDISMGQGSSYVFALYIGLMLGAASSGTILQLGWFSASRVMALGSSFSVIGVILVFPGEFKGMRFLYKLVPQSAYIGEFFQGFGGQMIGVSSLAAVEEIHSVLGRRSFTKKNSSTAATLWLCVWMGAVYGGNLLALMVMKYMSFTQGGWMLAGFSALSVALSVIQDSVIMIRRSSYIRLP